LHGFEDFDLLVVDLPVSQQSCSAGADMPVLSCSGQWLIVISMTAADDAAKGIAKASMNTSRRRSNLIG
jgi:hypothetical protein